MSYPTACGPWIKYTKDPLPGVTWWVPGAEVIGWLPRRRLPQGGAAQRLRPARIKEGGGRGHAGQQHQGAQGADGWAEAPEHPVGGLQDQVGRSPA